VKFSKNALVTALLIPLLLSSSGCIYLVVGGIGAVGGYIVSPDTVEGITENSPDEVWDAAIEILSIIGLIEEENHSGGLILASSSGAKITVTIIALNETAVKITVKARKAYLPKISLAQDVFVKIMSRVNE
jgi:hypothetical protein